VQAYCHAERINVGVSRTKKNKRPVVRNTTGLSLDRTTKNAIGVSHRWGQAKYRACELHRHYGFFRKAAFLKNGVSAIGKADTETGAPRG
jgi:hypothetical protein